MISIKYKTIRDLTVWYLLIPFLVFVGTWIQWLISIPCILLLGYGIYRQYKEDWGFSAILRIPVRGVLLIMIVSVIWCWNAGIGGFFYQSPDHHFRNAVFHDLFSCNWPVRYENYGTGLVYYLGIWIVPAAIGKLLVKFSVPFATAWGMAEMALLLWCGIGVILLVLLLCLYFRQYTLSGIAMLVLILIGFSGLDIVGELWRNGMDIHDHIEWWSGYFQFRSNTTALFWAYNQAIPCWLMTMLLLSEKNVRNYGFIVGSTLFFAPFTVVGIVPCVLVMAFRAMRSNKGKKIRQIADEICSCQNIVAVIVILPVLTAYYSCNAGLQSKIRFCWEDYGGLTGGVVKIWLAFLLLESGIYVCLFIKTEYKNSLMYAMVFSLIINSTISVGQTEEVVYRISATMPALFMLMCFVMKTIIYHKKKALFAFLVFMVGTFTPVIEYCRAITVIKEQKTLCLAADDLKTLNSEDAPRNFVGDDIAESFFYYYMAR